MAYRGARRSCPVCGTSLLALRVGRRRQEYCPGCGGRWLEHATLISMWSELAPGKTPELSPRKDGAGARPCPSCREPMERVELMVIPLDRCAEHGVWFDRRELETALAGAALSASDWLRMFAEDLTRMS
jgi:Zn-finger nucleic acid-binding protein